MDAESLIQNTITDVVYVSKLAAHLNQYSLIASIFPVINFFFLSRGRGVFLIKRVLNPSKKAVN